MSLSRSKGIRTDKANHALHYTGKIQKILTKKVVAQNLKDIEDDMKGNVRYLDIEWTIGRYDTVVLFEAPGEKVALNLALERLNRMKIEMLVAGKGEAGSPAGPTPDLTQAGNPPSPTYGT